MPTRDPRQWERKTLTKSDVRSRITARPDIFGGKPVVRDMRISAELIPGLLTQEVSPEAILDDYPDPEPDDIRALAAHAHVVIARDSLSTVSVAES